MKRAWLNAPNAPWENSLFKVTIAKTTIPNGIETIRKMDIPQTFTVPKRALSYCLQPAPLPERDLLQAFAALKCTVLNFLHIP